MSPGFPPAKGILLALLSAAIIVLIEFTFAISVSVYLFSGDLSDYVVFGIGAIMLASAIPTAVAVFFGTNPSTLCGARGASIPLLAALIAGVNGSLAASGRAEQILPTLIASIGVATIATGVLLIVFGHFRWGNLIRSIPYPVMGGFFAGLGYLFLTGALSVMTGTSVGLQELPTMLSAEHWHRWLPGVLLGLLLYLLQQRYRHWLVFPSAIAAAVAGFYLILLVSGTAPQAARETGWLLSLPEGSRFWPAIGPADFPLIHWGAVFAQGGAILALFAINAISLLLDASGIELMTRRDLDLNKELKTNGTANVVTGLLGGTAGVHSVGNTAFTYQLSGCNRLSALAYAFFALLAMVFGPTAAAVFPVPILGGLLCVIGFGFLDQWLVKGWRQLPAQDYALVVSILGSIAFFGVLPGVAVGFLLAVVQFALAYGRLSSVKYALSGKEMDTYVDRPEADETLLSEKGGRIHGIVLQGFLFFGTAHALLEQIRRRIDDPSQEPMRFLILDFRLVKKVDSSVAQSFEKLALLAEQRDFEIVFTDVGAEVAALFDRIGLPFEGERSIRCFDEFSEGGRWCQDRLIGGARPEAGPSHDIGSLLIDGLGLKEGPEQLAPFFKQIEVAAGDTLFRAGEEADGLYLVGEGRLNVYQETTGKSRRLRLVGPGSIIGEMAIYSNEHRSASVEAIDESILYHLTESSWQALRRQHPELAERFHLHIGRLLSQRLDKANKRLLRALG